MFILARDVEEDEKRKKSAKLEYYLHVEPRSIENVNGRDCLNFVFEPLEDFSAVAMTAFDSASPRAARKSFTSSYRPRQLPVNPFSRVVALPRFTYFGRTTHARNLGLRSTSPGGL